jgi:agarase
MTLRDAAVVPTLEDFRPDTLRGTPGFFRVGQARDGAWWLVDPLGQAFFSKGVAGVNRAGRTGARTAPLGAYAAAMAARHADAHAFLRNAIQRLRACHFNTLGAWTEPALEDQGMYYMETLELAGCGPLIRSGGVRLPDVFDPAWREAIEARARELCAIHRGSRELIGYFTDHALGWAQPLAHTTSAASGRTSASWPVAAPAPAAAWPTLLQVCLSLEPSRRAYHAAWEFVLATRRGELAALSRDWEIELPNKETLRQLTQAETALMSPGYLRDQRLFAREFARRYFATAAAAVRAHDPDHLILGCRFAAAPGEAVLSECVYPNVDVLSARPEADLWEKTAHAAHAARGMPVLLVELSWADGAFLRKPPGREPRGLTSVERMLRRGRAALEKICAQRAVVGYEWAAWADEEADAPPFGRGLVHLDDREAREHTEALALINSRAERLRTKQK